MLIRLNRKLSIILFKLIIILFLIFLILFHLNFNNNNNNEHDFNQKSEIVLNRIMNNNIESENNGNNNQISIKQMREQIEIINKKQEVLNLNKFGPLLTNDLVLIIQVHNRVQYLSALINSLNRTVGIDRTLVVFSHDVFDPEINKVVNSIDFCKVIQIFFPNSLQLNPNRFPGHSPNDCPRDISKNEALRIGCNNAMNSDKYGHYREGQICQTKHHWWWKINTVLDVLDITSNHFGYFMFLEEDHYLSPDAIHFWKLMNEFRNRYCEKCVITLGSYKVLYEFANYGYRIGTTKWISSLHNMGFVIDRNVWNRIRECGQYFCTFDDYNWDWTLHHLSNQCLDSPLITLFATNTRVYHTGGCGLHHKTSKCNNEEMVKKIEDNFKSAQKYLFPQKLVLRKSPEKRLISPKPNGGWADLRDHNLCLSAIQK